MVTEEPNMQFDMRPIDSSSGNSFFGKIGSRRVFIKLNASPLLPTLSTEGVTPKIEWIRKTPTGETLTAQTWIEGHTLSQPEMMDEQVCKILRNLHTNRNLRESLTTFDRSVARPTELLSRLLAEEKPVATNSYLRTVADEMGKTVPTLSNLTIVVVHGDISPSNWLRDERTGRIYLTDWDTVSLGDAFYDIGYLLSHFIPRPSWGEWLNRSGYDVKDILVLAKINWYGKLAFLRRTAAYLKQGNMTGANSEILGLRRFNELF